jgi:hypothetical protein
MVDDYTNSDLKIRPNSLKKFSNVIQNISTNISHAKVVRHNQRYAAGVALQSDTNESSTMVKNVADMR